MIASTLILLSILVPLTLSLMLSLSAVQNWVVGRAAQFASEYIGTEVSLGRIDVTMRGSVKLSNMLVRDFESDTLLYVNRAEAQILRFNPLSQRLRLGNGVINGAELNLRARGGDGDISVMNIKQVVDRISDRRGDGVFVLELADVVLNDGLIRIEQLTPACPSYGVDVRAMELNSISCAASSLTLDGPMVHGFVERLSLRERSGFVVNNLAGELYLTEGALSIESAILESRWSQLDIEQLLLVDNLWEQYVNFEESTILSLSVNRGVLASDDVAYFFPEARNWGLQLHDLDFELAGKISDMELSILNMTYGEATSLSADIQIKGLPDINSCQTQLMVEQLHTTPSDLDQLKWSIDGEGFDPITLSRLDALGDISLSGLFEGGVDGFSMEAEVSSGVGSVSTLSTIGLSGGLSIDGEASLMDVEVGRVLQDERLGRVSMSFSLDGVVDGIDSDLRLSAEVENFEAVGHLFRGISVAAEMRDRGVDGVSVESRDPSIRFDMEARAESIFGEGGVPKYKIDLDIDRVDLKKFEINRRDTTSVLSAHLRGEGEGRTIEECWGELYISDGLYLQNSDTLSIGGVSMSLSSSEEDRRVSIESDMIEAQFESTRTVAEITKFVSSAISQYLPAVYDETMTEVLIEGDEGDEGDAFDSRLYITTRKLNPLIDLIVPELSVGDSSTLNVEFNPRRNIFEARFNSPHFERGTTLAIGLDAQLDNRSDSLLMSAGIKELFVGTSIIEGATLMAGAKSNHIDVACHFRNSVDSATTNIGVTMDLSYEKESGRKVDLEILPSTMSRLGEVWRLSSKDVRLSRSGVDIDEFRIESRDQFMTLSGRASTNPKDTVDMVLSNFDLAVFSSLMSQLGYNIEGRTSGEASVSAALGVGHLEAQVELDSVSVNTLPAPPMMLRAEWDGPLNRARLYLTNRNNQDTLVRGYYIPSEVSYYANLKVDSLPMAVLDPPLGEVLSGTSGVANLDLILQGKRREAHLNGEIVAHNFSTMIDYTKVRYNMPYAMIRVEDNRLICDSTPINDGGSGNGDIRM